MNQIKKIINAYMSLEGINQQDMADMLNLERQTFNKKLNGHIPFSDKQKKDIAEIFKTTIPNIFFNDKVDDLSTKIIV